MRVLVTMFAVAFSFYLGGVFGKMPEIQHKVLFGCGGLLLLMLVVANTKKFIRKDEN